MAEAVQSVPQGESLTIPTPPTATPPQPGGRRRLVWLVVLLLGGLAGTAAWIAKVLVIVFLVLFVVSLLRGKA